VLLDIFPSSLSITKPTEGHRYTAKRERERVKGPEPRFVSNRTPAFVNPALTNLLVQIEQQDMYVCLWVCVSRQRTFELEQRI